MNDLALRSTVRDLVAAFAAAEAEIRAAFARICAAEKRLNDAFSLADRYGRMRIDATSSGYHDDFDNADRAIARLRTQAWECIIDRLEIRRAMSIKREAELTRQVADERDPPEITEELVFAFARQHSDFKAMWAEAIVEVFDWLRRHHSDYKTNLKNARLELGPRLIITHAIERSYEKPGFRVCHHDNQRFIALSNIFTGLDGKGTIAATHYGPIGDAVAASGIAGVGETEYFAFRCFRNGNMHLRFKRLDLLEKFNRAAGGMNLKPESSAA